MISAEAVANYFIDLARQDECCDLTPMKLQKLVYVAHGWHLALYDKPLINEHVEAWRFGPVVRSVYHEFKEFGDQPISRHAMNMRLVDGNLEEYMPSIKDCSDDTSLAKGLLDRVWQVYHSYTPVQLSNMTHQPGTPWDQVASHYKHQLPRRLIHIPNESIKAHFLELAEKNAA